MELMKISQQGVDLIKRHEGLRLKAYKCPAGVWTIGYGHTKGVTSSMVINELKAEAFLREDISPIENVLNKMGVNFTQRAFDALCSWIFNLGVGNFNVSTLRKKIVANAPDEEITDQIIKWVNAGGKPLLGLKKRRVDEANMWLGRQRYYVNSAGKICKR